VKRRQKAPVELFEEAVHLLRNAPAAVLASYYAGALPFMLGLIVFWADMTQNAIAWEHCLPGSLAVALLYCWMIYGQTVFVRGLQAELSGTPGEPRFSGTTQRFAFLQMTLQSSKFFVLPAAALMILPYAGAYSFYQNLMAASDGEPATPGAAIRDARKHSNFWQSQNWTILGILVFVNLVVFLNIGTAILLLPALLKVLLGIDTVFSRSGASAVNTTFFAITAGLTYLAANPVAKAVYLLRYFYAESRETGDDLRAECKSALSRAEARLQAESLPHKAKATQAGMPVLHRPEMAMLILGLLLLPAAANGQAPAPAPAVSPNELNQAIDQVIHRPEFTWRMPRAPQPPAESANWFVRQTQAFLNAMGRGVRQVGKWIDQFFTWLGDKLKHLLPGIGGNQPAADARRLRLFIYALLAGVAIVLAWLLWQVRRTRKRRVAVKVTPTAIPVVELNNPDLQADQQPLDEWLLLARDCTARQEFRLALRAFYLAGLSYLAGRSLISIQRGKSNRDYARELRRKARNQADLLAAFQQNLGVFEKTWYGLYDVDRSLVEQFEATLSEMRSYASRQ
jgi:uncharacterized protein DUF4129